MEEEIPENNFPLPNELLIEILTFLNEKDRSRLALVDKRFNFFTKHPFILESFPISKIQKLYGKNVLDDMEKICECRTD